MGSKSGCILLLLAACHRPDATDPTCRWNETPIGAWGLWSVASDGDEAWATAQSYGTVLHRTNAGWASVGDGETSYWTVDAEDGRAWAVNAEQLLDLRADEDPIALPERFSSVDAVVVRGDGTVAVLATPNSTCDDCYDTLPQQIVTWDGQTFATEDAPMFLRDLVEMDDGRLLGVGYEGTAIRDDLGWDVFDLGPVWFTEVTTRGFDMLAVSFDEGLAMRGPPDAPVALDVGTFVSRHGVLTDDGAVLVGFDGDAPALWRESTGQLTPLPDEVNDLDRLGDGVVLVGGRSGNSAYTVAGSVVTEEYKADRVGPTEDLWASDDGVFFLLGPDSLAMGDGATYTRLPSENGALDGLRALSGASADEVHAIGDRGFVDWNGATLTPTPKAPDDFLADVDTAPDGTTLAVGARRDPADESETAVVYAWDDGWTEVAAPDVPALYGVTVFGATDALAVAFDRGETTLWSWDGAGWERDPLAIIGVQGVSGTRDDLWVTAEDVVWHIVDGVADEIATDGAPFGVRVVDGTPVGIERVSEDPYVFRVTRWNGEGWDRLLDVEDEVPHVAKSGARWGVAADSALWWSDDCAP